MSRVIVLGIDPGIANVGWGKVEWTAQGVRYLDSGFITTPPEHLLQARIETIISGLTEALVECSHVAIESLPHKQWQRSLMDVTLVIGAIQLQMWREGFYVHPYTPTAVKATVTGNGGAKKGQIIDAVQRILGLRIANNHEADALAVALTCWRQALCKANL